MEAGLLITPEQIKRRAREEAVPAGVVEKDYAITWLLRGLYLEGSGLRNILVLKGGTAIRRVYFPETWRFSEDLDFTLLGDVDTGRIRESLEGVFDALRIECGVGYSLESFHATSGTVVANVQFLGPLNYVNRIKQDITLTEKMVLKPEWKAIVSRFPDLPSSDALVYSLEEILVEKTRSIMQRGYSRDYYDVWRLLKEDRFEKKEIKNLLVQKCELNGIEYRPDLIFDRDRLEQANAFWVRGLSYLTKDPPSFATVISELRSMLSFLNT